MNSLVPSLPASSENELVNALRELEGIADSFQIDMVDGVFAPSLAWPFTESDPIQALDLLADWSSKFVLELDCMVNQPEQYLDKLVALGVKRVIVHIGSTENIREIIQHARKNFYKLGLAITNDTAFDELSPYLAEIDFVQVMGIAVVGTQGQPFDERTLIRVSDLRLSNPTLEIAVDGAVNATTIPLLLKAGANRLAPGSAIIKATEPKLAYLELKKLLV
jgi:ribulose-phosphate 3-epimerase